MTQEPQYQSEELFDTEPYKRERLQIGIPPRYAPAKTKVGSVRCAVRDDLKQHSNWVGGVDPMNVVLVLAIIAVPVIGATLMLLVLVAVALALVVFLW